MSVVADAEPLQAEAPQQEQHLEAFAAQGLEMATAGEAVEQEPSQFQEQDVPAAQDQGGGAGEQFAASSAAPNSPKLSPQHAKMKAQEAQYRQKLREIAKKPAPLKGVYNPVPCFEARLRQRHQEKTTKMKALEAEYRRKVDEIAAKPSVLKLPDNPLPSFEARVQSTTDSGSKKLVAGDAEYKTWVQQRTSLQAERINKVITERSASVADMRATARARRQQQLAESTQMQSVGHLFHGVPHGRPPKPTHSRSVPGFVPLSPEEKQAIMEKFNNPIWEKSLAERANAERVYWRWASSLKARTQCAVDHHFDGPSGGHTDAQQELIETVAREREYWKWASSLHASKSCTIDQTWA